MRFIRNIIVVLTLLAMIWSCAESDASVVKIEEISGAKIYKQHCRICHGDDGRKGFAKAAIIPESTLSLDERVALITRGKGKMMPYTDVLNKEEIKAVAEYTFTLQ